MSDAPHPIVSVRLDGSTGLMVAIRPQSYLGGESFDAYRTAVEGAQFVKEKKAQIAPVGKASILLSRLQAAGFALEVEPAAMSAIQQASLAMAKSKEETERHVNRVDAELMAQGKQLYPYQRTGVRWLAGRINGLLADEPGLGKSCQSLVSIPEMAPALVVCPAAVKGVWRDEAAKWRPELKVHIIENRASFRWPSPGELIICNYEQMPGERVLLPEAAPVPAPPIASAPLPPPAKPRMPWDIPVLRSDTPPAPVAPMKAVLQGDWSDVPEGLVLIADEAHCFKNPKAVRTERFRKLSEATMEHGGRVWLLTGTPVLNEQIECWAILRAGGLASEAFGTFQKFADAAGGFTETIYVKPPEGERPEPREILKWGPVKDGEAVFRGLSKVMLRRHRAEVLPELPKKTYQAIPVDLTNQKILMKQCELALPEAERMILQLGHQHQDQAEITFETLSKARSDLAASKIPAMLALVQQYEEARIPLLVFSAHRAPIDALAARPGWRTLTGDTAEAERREFEHWFQHTDPYMDRVAEAFGAGLTIQAGGVGLTLTRAAHVLFVDRLWTPALNLQAEDRVCRIGQTRGVLIMDLVADCALDRRVHAVLAAKQKIISDSVDWWRDK